jgi:predicted MFS family arabinose efflux permease
MVSEQATVATVPRLRPGARDAKIMRHRARTLGGLLRQHDFRQLWIGETTSKFGSAITTVAMPLVAVTTLHAGTFAVGALEAANWLPWLLVGLPAGAHIDRWRRRPVLIRADLIAAVAFVTVPIAAWLGVLTVAQLITVALVSGTAAVFFRVAYQAYLPAVVTTVDLPEGNAKMHGSASAAEVAGPGLAGLLAQTLGAVAALLVDAGTFLVSIVCLLRIRVTEPVRTAGRPESSLRERIGTGLRYVRHEPYLRTLILYAAASNVMLTATQALLVVFLVRTVGAPAGVIGMLMASAGVGGVFGATIARPFIQMFGSARAALVCALGTAPFGLLIPLTRMGPRLALFVIGMLILPAGVVISNIIGSSFRQAYCPPDMLGRVSATTSFLVLGAMPLGALIGGTLGTVLGVRPALWVSTVMFMLPALILVFSPLSKGRDLPAPATGQATSTPAMRETPAVI